MPLELLCNQPLQAPFFSSLNTEAHQWPICSWRGLTPWVRHGSWKAFRRNSTARWTANYRASSFCIALNYNFLPWRFSLLDPHVKIWAVWGQIWNVWPTCCSKATQAVFPLPVLPLYDFICDSGGGWLNIRREREHSIKLQAEKVCQLFFFLWLLGCTDSFWQFPLFCAHKISLMAEFSLR